MSTSINMWFPRASLCGGEELYRCRVSVCAGLKVLLDIGYAVCLFFGVPDFVLIGKGAMQSIFLNLFYSTKYEYSAWAYRRKY
jgi:hypothetical protein